MSHSRSLGLTGLNYLELRGNQHVDDEKVGRLQSYVPRAERMTGLGSLGMAFGLPVQSVFARAWPH